MKLPGPDHPITITPEPGRVRVRFGGRTIAETSRALRLQEASYKPVFYIPREDADMANLRRTDHSTHCPYKGDANYFSIAGENGRGENAVWTYETPFPAVSEITGYLAFYSDRVDAIETAP
jgi:uncharacterized protein (DUF427 family)